MTTGRHLWRDTARGKHHIAPNAYKALCGRRVESHWQTETTVRWADEDCCRVCIQWQHITTSSDATP